MFGINAWEILIILFILAVPVVIAVVVIVVTTRGKSRSSNPNLTPCPDCRRLVSIHAKSCPQCGGPLE